MYDLQTVMDTLKESAGAIKKVGSVAEKVFGAKWRKAQADADAYAIDTIADTMRRNDDMKITYNNGAVSIEKKEYDRLLDSARLREEQETVKQQKNIEAMFNYMIEELRKASKVSDEPVDEDFVDRLVENAKKTNKKELQFLWGKILAREVVKPGSFSLRTLEIVRNLNKIEAEMIQKVATVALKHGKQYFLVAKLDLTFKYGVDFAVLLAMEECGILQSFEALPLNFNIAVNSKIGLENNNEIIIIENKNQTNCTLSVNAYKFTQAGQELLDIVMHDSVTKFIHEYALFLRNDNPNLITEVHKILEGKENGDIIYSEEPVKL